MPNIQIVVNGKSYTVTLSDTEAARALLGKLPMTIHMRELNGNEKYHYFDTSFPAKAHSVGQIQAGDLMLYGSDCLVLFYESFRTPYSYTRIGRVDNADGLAAALGAGDVDVSFQLR